MVRVIWQEKLYRIVEVEDTFTTLDQLKEDLEFEEEQDEKEFEQLVKREGVYGYTLEKWNPAIGAGWDFVDSSFRFIGSYDPNNEKFNHYIVQEFKDQATKAEAETKAEIKIDLETLKRLAEELKPIVDAAKAGKGHLDQLGFMYFHLRMAVEYIDIVLECIQTKKEI
jgi:hypothetical protein